MEERELIERLVEGTIEKRTIELKQKSYEELQEENERLALELSGYRTAILNDDKLLGLQQRINNAIEYITSYEAISTIQGLDKIEQNKKLDERTMNVMVERYLKVHHNLLNILQGEDK